MVRSEFALWFRPHSWGKICVHIFVKWQKGICGGKEDIWIIIKDFCTVNFLVQSELHQTTINCRQNKMKLSRTNMGILLFNKKCSVLPFSIIFAKLHNFSHSSEDTWSHAGNSYKILLAWDTKVGVSCSLQGSCSTGTKPPPLPFPNKLMREAIQHIFSFYSDWLLWLS